MKEIWLNLPKVPSAYQYMAPPVTAIPLIKLEFLRITEPVFYKYMKDPRV